MKHTYLDHQRGAAAISVWECLSTGRELYMAPMDPPGRRSLLAPPGDAFRGTAVDLTKVLGAASMLAFDAFHRRPLDETVFVIYRTGFRHGSAAARSHREPAPPSLKDTQRGPPQHIYTVVLLYG